MNDDSEAQSRNNMIMHMEQTLNQKWFARRDKKDILCKLSTAQYWDWLVYLDVSTPLC